MVKPHLFSYHRPTGGADSLLIDDYLQAAVQHNSDDEKSADKKTS